LAQIALHSELISASWFARHCRMRPSPASTFGQNLSLSSLHAS
jgi:hypothetical protein